MVLFVQASGEAHEDLRILAQAAGDVRLQTGGADVPLPPVLLALLAEAAGRGVTLRSSREGPLDGKAEAESE